MLMKTQDPIVAVIDLGSNSIKLLVAKGDPCSRVQPLLYKSEDIRIGQATKQLILPDEAIAAAAHSVQSLYHAALEHYQPAQVQVVGTSAVREAKNHSLLSERIYALTGLHLRILSGEEEALAIAQGVQLDPQLKDLSSFNLFDLGGGSLELIHFDAGKVKQALSLPLGAVRLMEDLVSCPEKALSPQEADAIANTVKCSVKNSKFNYFQEFYQKNRTPPPLIGTGGAMTILKKLFPEDTPILKKHDLYRLFIQVARAGLQDRIQRYKLPAKRADTFPVGLAIILTLLQLSQQEGIRHSYYSLRFGLAYEMLQPVSSAQPLGAPV